MAKEIRLGVNDVVEITHATLLNQPSISYFNGFCADVCSVKRGNLFIATSSQVDNLTDNIKEALQKGAYGVLFDGDIAISDNEVAWISTESLEESLLRLVRHYLIANNIVSFLLHKEEFELASAMLEHNPAVVSYSGGLVGLLENVCSGGFSYLVFAPITSLDKHFFKESHTTELCKKLPFELVSYSLFELRIIYHSQSYSIPIPKFFSNTLGSVIELLEKFSLNLDLQNITYLSSFYPLYLDVHGVLTQIGQSNRVALCCDNMDLFEKYMAYFAINAKWAKTILFTPEKYEEFFRAFGETYIYESMEHLGFLFKDLHYNFALVFGLNSRDLECYLKNKVVAKHSLFE